MKTELEKLLDRLDAAASTGSQDSIRTIALRLDEFADAPARKNALFQLKNPSTEDISEIAKQVRRVFLDGTIGPDGWRRRR